MFVYGYRLFIQRARADRVYRLSVSTASVPTTVEISCFELDVDRNRDIHSGSCFDSKLKEASLKGNESGKCEFLPREKERGSSSTKLIIKERLGCGSNCESCDIAQSDLKDNRNAISLWC